MEMLILASGGKIHHPAWLLRAEAVHRQLRTQMAHDYSAKIQRVTAGGATLCAAVDGAKVLGLALYRCYENTYTGLHFYIDDLVTDEAHRSQGVGKFMLDYLQREARKLDADCIALDSGTQRQQAHRFYFREGFTIPSFNFRKGLKK
ncbi:GNAT family N-acetyltransferase [Parvibium lacunae]|uniref:GNAT family N-acetyltransferase n=1 Tax=Parvibium lacunae TaxID=1888893 RepID=A0A368L7B5_9BURK|nr:GNAT family N-acetyltransferase [Parvibium lacunae]RCS59401.1 GNAT family N-acetyltransferase [Parvibium lacunae]